MSFNRQFNSLELAIEITTAQRQSCGSAILSAYGSKLYDRSCVYNPPLPTLTAKMDCLPFLPVICATRSRWTRLGALRNCEAETSAAL